MLKRTALLAAAFATLTIVMATSAQAGAGADRYIVVLKDAVDSNAVANLHSARYGASVAEETSDWRQAYATVERFRRERPPNWARLPPPIVDLISCQSCSCAE